MHLNYKKLLKMKILWYVEKKIRKRKGNGLIEWLVKFEGWPDKCNSWIPERDIT